MSNQIAPFNNFPEEKICDIFSCLDVHELGVCSKVCWQFNEIAHDDSLWNHLFPLISIPLDSRKYLVSGEKGIVKRFAQFLQKIPVGQTGKLEILNAFDPAVRHSLCFCYGKKEFIPGQPSDVLERWFDISPPKSYGDETRSYTRLSSANSVLEAVIGLGKSLLLSLPPYSFESSNLSASFSWMIYENLIEKHVDKLDNSYEQPAPYDANAAATADLVALGGFYFFSVA